MWYLLVAFLGSSHVLILSHISCFGTTERTVRPRSFAQVTCRMSGRAQSGLPVSNKLDKAIDVLAAKIAAEVRVSKKSGVVNTKNNSTPVKSANHIIVEDYARPFLDFLNGNPTVFHATKYFSEKLDTQGFVRLSEKHGWDNLKAGGKYYVTRNGSSLVAFSIPEKYRPGNGVGELQIKLIFTFNFSFPFSFFPKQ